MAYTARQRIQDLDALRIIPDLLTNHLTKRPDAVAYKSYDNKQKIWRDITFKQTFERVLRWRKAWASFEEFVRGDRIAMLLPNCYRAICFDQSVLANAYVPVPLHAIDTPKSSAFILENSEAKALVTNKLLKWKQIRDSQALPDLRLVIITDEETMRDDTMDGSVRVMSLAYFLTLGQDLVDLPAPPEKDDLAALVYTSGTTGRPKGVMLTHDNVLSNLRGILIHITPHDHETLLSFLPLSHTFRRTASYYLALGLGYTLAFNRSIAHIQDDLKVIRPTVLMSVPRIYEMIYSKIQDGLRKKSGFVRMLFQWAVDVGWRRFCRENNLRCEKPLLSLLDPLVAGFLDKKVGEPLRAVFGGRPHLFITGGAAMPFHVVKTFSALGITILQGYGLTETSPVIAVNLPGENHIDTVGPILDNIEHRFSSEGELQVRGPSIMQGYWKRDDANKEIFTKDGWLRTGDVCELRDNKYLRITGRIKEIIVTSTGEKVPPADLEAAIQQDPLFSQVMVLGDDRPFISAVAVVHPDRWAKLCAAHNVDPQDPASLSAKPVVQEAIRRIKAQTRSFPNYGVPRQVTLTTEAWTIDNGFLTPTLKLKRRVVMQRFDEQIEKMYETLGGGKTK